MVKEKAQGSQKKELSEAAVAEIGAESRVRAVADAVVAGGATVAVFAVGYTGPCVDADCRWTLQVLAAGTGWTR